MIINTNMSAEIGASNLAKFNQFVEPVTGAPVLWFENRVSGR